MTDTNLSDVDYQALAGFTHFSEKAAEGVGLAPQQHQALLAIRAENGLTVGELADRMMVRPHSATGLADRLAKLDLIARQPATTDRRRIALVLTPAGEAMLRSLSEIHRAELRRLRPTLLALLERL